MLWFPQDIQLLTLLRTYKIRPREKALDINTFEV